MNERIRELYEQARLHAKTIDSDLDPQGWMDEYHKKFAELIIQECVNVLHDNELWSRDVSHVLKEHFGVE